MATLIDILIHKVIADLMEQYPVTEFTELQPNSKDHARHALEQGLVDGEINRSAYEELIGYVIHVMYNGQE